MESRIRILFLTIILLINTGPGFAEEKSTQQDKSLNQVIQQEPLIQPEITRREITEANIDVADFELGAFLGLLSIEDFGTNPVYGIRLDYHVTEDLFLEGTLGFSQAGKTSADNFLPGVSVLGDDKDYIYYNVAIGYNILPGESFLGGEKTFNTALYLIAGAGITEFGGDDRFTITVGGGYRVSVTDYMAMHIDFRDHIFRIDITGEDKDAHNFELTLGLNYVF